MILVAVTLGSGYIAMVSLLGRADNRDTVAAASALVDNHNSRPIVVRTDGPIVTISTGPAVSAKLISDGRAVYYDHFWGREDYDDQRRIERAPDAHLTLWLLQRRDDGTWPTLETESVIESREVNLKRTGETVRLVLTTSDP